MAEGTDSIPPARGYARGVRRLLATTALGAAVLLYAWWADPGRTVGYLPCTFHWLTGLHCPGCGGQRALHALLHGKLVEAVQLNALAVLIVLPAGVGTYLRYAHTCLGQAPTGGTLRLKRWVTAFLVLALIYGVVRNLPGEAFALLRP